MTKWARFATLLVVLALGLLPIIASADHTCSGPDCNPDYPCPASVEYTRRYYSDPAMTNLVGVHLYDCECRHWFWGTLQGYMVYEEWQC
jgi:hypothetical protein